MNKSYGAHYHGLLTLWFKNMGTQVIPGGVSPTLNSVGITMTIFFLISKILSYILRLAHPSLFETLSQETATRKYHFPPGASLRVQFGSCIFWLTPLIPELRRLGLVDLGEVQVRLCT